MALVIYGMGPSPFVRKVRVAFVEKGMDYTLENVNIFPAPDWFKEISALKRIPVLRDTDRPEPNTIPDSSAICAYAEQVQPTPSLYPSEGFERGRAAWIEEYADTEMAGVVGLGVFRPVALAALMGKDIDAATAEKTMAERMPAIFDFLEAELGDDDYLVGNSFSIADISVATQFVNLQHAGFKPDAAQWPKLAAYVARIHDRPSFKALIEEEAALFAKTRAA